MKIRTISTRLLCSLSLVAALQAGCSDDDDDDFEDAGSGAGSDAGIDASTRGDGGGSSGSDAGAESDADVATLSEGQIVGIAAAINAGEIAAGTLAQTKAVSTAAKDYATMMITMHTATQQRQTALGITPAPSAQQQTLMSMAATALQTLQSTPAGAAFDTAYLESQVTMHSSAREIIDNLLLPSATTPALRAELTTTRGEVVTHLSEAQGLLSGDAGVGGTASGLDAGG